MTYIVLYAFRDRDNYNLIHNIGEDVSYMDANRLTELVARGYVKIEGGVIPPDPAKPATIEPVATHAAMQIKIASQAEGTSVIYFITADEENGGGFPAIYIRANNNTIRLIPQLTA